MGALFSAFDDMDDDGSFGDADAIFGDEEDEAAPAEAAAPATLADRSGQKHQRRYLQPALEFE